MFVGKKTGEQLDNVITANATSSTLPTLQNACIECQTEVDGKVRNITCDSCLVNLLLLVL